MHCVNLSSAEIWKDESLLYRPISALLKKLYDDSLWSVFKRILTASGAFEPRGFFAGVKKDKRSYNTSWALKCTRSSQSHYKPTLTPWKHCKLYFDPKIKFVKQALNKRKIRKLYFDPKKSILSQVLTPTKTLPTVKLIYSEKATKFYKISTLFLSYIVPVKSKVEILQNLSIYDLYYNPK